MYRKYRARETELWKRTEARDIERIEPNNPIPPRPTWIKLGLTSYAMQYKSKLKSATDMVLGCVWNGETVPVF
ncbi:hypothetical protein RHGRI_020234 [Rhododendron griersonianum]|uniref:Uncharacterized protein n=1 Tax=Rhododendron griersonianum TaxID=479676 RepID=A0AAV6JFR0_9ERIC|nr:hypothetical protein RHGRI_020234 [Rhododendron griersonianum]